MLITHVVCLFLPLPFSANKAVEVNEMWRVRQKELELNDRLKGMSQDDIRHNRRHGDTSKPSRNTNRRHERNVSASCSSSKRVAESCFSREDEGLRDEEVEEFLHTRFVPPTSYNFFFHIFCMKNDVLRKN